jgi:hypothetical protein
MAVGQLYVLTFTASFFASCILASYGEHMFEKGVQKTKQSMVIPIAA